MSTKFRSVSAAPQIGGKASAILFIAVLLAFVVESQLAQYVQTNLHYRQPFFIFYLVHSSFAIIFPLHLLYLAVTTKYTTAALFRGLQLAITNHLSPTSCSESRSFPTFKFFRLVMALTAGITFPGLLWFASISLASVSDVTAIWNSNAFFAYLITVKLFGLKWEVRKILAVTLATVGVVMVVYGGASQQDETANEATMAVRPTAPLIGNLLTLLASFGYGLYQVLYKVYATLPSDPESKQENLYQTVPEDEDEGVAAEREVSAVAFDDDAVYPPPYGLHANLLTSLMGVVTCLVLGIFLPILHNTGLEIFHWPSDGLIVASIVGIASTGVVFNSGLMVLLGTWGPIITSVGNLLTIVLVLISDIIFGNGMATITIWSLVGCSAIVFAFGVLAYDMFVRRS